MEKYYYTGILRNPGEVVHFACFKFSDVPYHLENVKMLKAKSKKGAEAIRKEYDRLYLLLPLAPKSKRAGIIARLTTLKVSHDIHG